MRPPSEWPIVGWFDSAGKIFGGIGGLVVLIGGIVTLVDRLSPSPPPPRKAELEVQRVRKTSLEYYLVDSGRAGQLADYAPNELEQVGNYYYVRVSVEGLRGRKSEIVWSLDRRDKGTPIEDLEDASDWIHQLLQTVKPPANIFEFVAKVWIQRPQFPGSFYAILEINYPEDQSLGVTETPPFVVEAAPPKTQTTFLTTTTVETIPATTVSVTTTMTPTVTATTGTTTGTTPTTTAATTTDVVTTTTTETIPATTTTRVVKIPRVTTVPLAPAPTIRPKAKIVRP